MSGFKQEILHKLETYADLFDNAHDLIHVVEPDGRILYVNKAWEAILGYSQDEIEGKSIYSFVQESDRSAFRDYRNNIVAGNYSQKQIVVRAIAKSGDVVYLEGFVSAKSVSGKTLYTRGIFRDVTAKLQSEIQLKSALEQLKDRESNLQHLLSNAPDAIIVVDTESKILYWNPKAEIVFGWASQEVLGRRLQDVIIPSQYRQAHEEGMKRYLATGEQRVLNKTIEVTALKKDDSEFHVALTISSTAQNGRPAFIAFIRDITEQKRNEADLQQKKTELERSNQQLEQFAHIASHDLKEPTRKIALFAEQVQEDTTTILSAKSRHYLERISKSALRLSSMVDGVLAHSTLRAEEIAVQKTALRDVIENIKSDFELTLQEKEAIIKYSDLPSIDGVPFLIYQLFYNLISNSLKFSRPAVKPVIEITASKISGSKLDVYKLDPHRSYHEIILKDNGIGFREEHAEAIFKIFKRLHSKDTIEGTGLGLSLCKTIVEKHNGAIVAHGKENAGAAFHIYLPALEA